MKINLYSSKKQHWLKTSAAFLTCLMIMVTPSCQKDILNQDSLPDISLLSSSKGKPTATVGKIKDVDGNWYKTIKIGDQWWMAENLGTTRYKDRTNIPLVTDNTDWANLSTPGYCFYNNDAATYKATYGALYNWYVVDKESNGDKELCPTGWHVPSDAEWTVLMNYLGGTNLAGGKLKATGTIQGGDGLWNDPNEGATNETGFAALPGGFRWDNTYNGIFNHVGNFGFWWSANVYNLDPNTVISPSMTWFLVNVSWNNSTKGMGLSVRCIKD